MVGEFSAAWSPSRFLLSWSGVKSPSSCVDGTLIMELYEMHLKTIEKEKLISRSIHFRIFQLFLQCPMSPGLST